MKISKNQEVLHKKLYPSFLPAFSLPRPLPPSLLFTTLPRLLHFILNFIISIPYDL